MRMRWTDFPLIRREDDQQRNHEARSLRALWPRLNDITVMELKSPGRAFRPSELICQTMGPASHSEVAERRAPVRSCHPWPQERFGARIRGKNRMR